MERQARALGIAMTVLIDENVPDTASLDRDKVAWAITNLVGSALRHARKPGGSVVVQVAYDPARWALCISVRDDGPGIPADRLERLLNRTPWHPGGALETEPTSRSDRSRRQARGVRRPEDAV
jgi:signal transduction histidine kinase